MKPIKIKLISDVHLEMRDNKLPIDELGENYADILILAGDISLVHLEAYFKFLEYCTSEYKDVILIAGNHEYYHSKGVDHVEGKIMEVVERVNNNRDIPNLHYLQRNYVDINGIRFLGCTLWTKIPEVSEDYIKEHMNDYSRIRYKVNYPNGTIRRLKIKPNNTVWWHKRDTKWLEETILESALPVVIVTHHAPSFDGTINPILKDDPINKAYATDLEVFMHSKVKLWCYGHTHWYNQRKIHETTIWSNPLGYPGEKTGHILGDTFTISI